ncbi:MAG: hypothetical protein WCI71_08920, partial [Bacteroidota bacterium]
SIKSRLSEHLFEKCGKQEEIRKLLTFLKVRDEQLNIGALSAIPITPSSLGRSRSMQTPWLTLEDKKLMEQLGFL